MGTIKVWSLGGLDQKSNDLTRSTEKASEMQNMEYDTQSTIKKRTGYDQAFTYTSDDMIYYQNKDEKLFFNSGSSTVRVYKADNSYKALTMPFTVLNADISASENQGNIYFTSTDLSIPVMKYDGSNIYRAGLPAPRKISGTTEDVPTWTSPLAGYYTRLFYGFKDINGNLTFSPYVQYDIGTGAGADLTIGTFKNNAYFKQNGFLDKYCFINSSSSTYLSTYATISSGSRTLTVSKHNYAIGDKFLFDTDNYGILISSSKSYLVLEVEAINTAGTNITFTAASIGTDTITIRNLVTSGSSQPIDVRSRVYIATSAAPDTGYKVQSPVCLDNSSDTYTVNTVNPEAWTYEGRPSEQADFEDIYDSTTFKIMPPYCKYLTSYGNQIIYGNIGKFFNNDNTSVNYDNDDIIIFSDLNIGDGPENISPLNIQKIGETWDGSITGLKRANDSLVVFKNHGVFSLDGFLLPSQYQVRKINTNYVGCTSHKSILDAEEGLYFQSHNGIYYTNAIAVKKISYELDFYFGSENYNLTRSVRYKEKQKALFYIDGSGLTNQKIVVVDYYYNQVYFWTGITPTGGFIENKDGDVFFSDKTKVYKFNSSVYHDGASAIDAYYSTTYHHCGEPALRKKFLAIRIFSLTSDTFTLTLTHDSDWKNDITQNPHTISFTSSDQTQRIVHDMQTVRAQRYTFRNNTINEPMVLTGYEITWEPYEQLDKN